MLNIPSSEAGAVILKIAYGYTIEPHTRDPLVHIANLALEHFSIAGTPGTWLVDIIPACKWSRGIPTVPGSAQIAHQSSEILASLASRSRLQAHCAGMESKS